MTICNFKKPYWSEHSSPPSQSQSFNLYNPISFGEKTKISKNKSRLVEWKDVSKICLPSQSFSQSSFYHDFHKLLSNKTVSFPRFNILSFLSAHKMPDATQIASGEKNNQRNQTVSSSSPSDEIVQQKNA